jgi:hypothetical protein
MADIQLEDSSYFKDQVRATLLAGISFASAVAIVAGDTILAALGKLQAQITALGASKQATLVSAVNIKTVNGTTLLGAGDVAISGSGIPIAAGSGAETTLMKFAGGEAADSGITDDPAGHMVITSSNSGGNGNIAIVPTGLGQILFGANNPTTAPLIRLYTGAILIQRLAFKAATPAQITGNQNDYTIAYWDGSVARLASDASRNITGFVWDQNAEGGDVRHIINIGAQDIVLKHQDAGSTAANRMISSTGADITLSGGQGAEMWYDVASSRWRVFKKG